MNAGRLQKGLNYLKYTALLFLLYFVNSIVLPGAISPTQASSLESMTMGARVRATRDLEVRKNASTSATLLSTEPLESRGTVVGGPTSANGVLWWQVNYDSGSTGWTDGAGLETVTASRFFQQPSTWYQKISPTPVIYPDSAAIINNIRQHSDALGISYGKFSHPIFYARPDTATTAVQVSRKAPTAKALGWVDVPIPNEARPAGFGTSGYSDGHMTIISHDRKYAWDFYQAEREVTSFGILWKASYLRRWDLSRDGINSPYDALGSVKLCPFPILHGLVTHDEMKRAYIDHAMIFSVNNQKTNYWGRYPCETFGGGSNTNSNPPQGGMRIQLDPSVNIDALGLSPPGKIVARALQEYGMISADSAGTRDFDIYFENLDFRPDKASWRGLLPGDLPKIPKDRLRVVESPRPPFSGNASAPVLTRVRAKQSVNIYVTPFDLSTPSKTLAAGATGTLLSEPVVVNGVTWWFIDYDDPSPSSHYHGWTKAELLEKQPGSLPSSLPTRFPG
jgi:hypothetical protein